ncbi:MAG: hydantoinase B/oxoprolinase family protein [Pseudomonadota bacterium]
MHDFTVVTPTFRRGRLVALFACTSHVVDIGGRGMTPDARHVFEEGLYVPLMRFAVDGKVNETLVEIVEGNVREPGPGGRRSLFAGGLQRCRQPSPGRHDGRVRDRVARPSGAHILESRGPPASS